jgi:hypothetical protein
MSDAARVSCGVPQAHSHIIARGRAESQPIHPTAGTKSGASGNNPDNGSRVSRDFGDFEPVRVCLPGFDRFEVAAHKRMPRNKSLADASAALKDASLSTLSIWAKEYMLKGKYDKAEDYYSRVSVPAEARLTAGDSKSRSIHK